jgi:hypothetical protein
MVIIFATWIQAKWFWKNIVFQGITVGAAVAFGRRNRECITTNARYAAQI